MEKFIKNVNGYVVIANINAPLQTIISGEKEVVMEVAKQAGNSGVTVRLLPVSGAFHSDMMKDAAHQLKKLTSIPDTLLNLSTTLLSSVTGNEVLPGLNMREHFAGQMLEQVNFIPLVKEFQKHCDSIIEVGPGRILSGLIDQIGGSGGIQCFPIASQPELGNDLNAVLSHAFVHGVDINWDVVYENRLVRPFVPASERLFIDNPCERPFISAKPSTNNATKIDANDQLKRAIRKVSGIDNKMFEDYFVQRQEFLTKVIEADIQSLPQVLTANTIDPQAIQGDKQTTDNENNGSLQLQQTSPIAFDNNSTEGIQRLLKNLVHDRTGFPPETISFDYRLLDDLNLDSIKAGALIGSIAKSAGVAGKLNPAGLANAKLSEIISAILEITKLPDPSDSNINKSDNILSTGPDSISNVSTSNWVRNFTIQHVPQDADSDKNLEINWASANVLIRSDVEQNDQSLSLKRRFTDLGGKAEVYQCQEDIDRLDIINANITHIIGVLPKSISLEANENKRLSGLIDLLSGIVKTTIDSNAPNVLFVQYGNGYFGAGIETADPEVCCTTSFARSFSLERPDLHIKVIDLSTAIQEEAATGIIVDEMSGDDQFAAVGFNADLVRLVQEVKLSEPATYTKRPYHWSSKDVILVTGGAKGITAECSIALARSTGAKFALVGSSQITDNKDNNEAAMTVQRFKEEKLVCRYYKCDISDFDSVQKLIQQVNNDMGPITAVVHGAGVNTPRRVEQATVMEARNEVAPKLLGARNLCAALSSNPPRIFAAFTSIIGVTGMPGNAWYAFSNEALDLILRKFGSEYQDTSVISIAYSVWKEAGMGRRLGIVDNLAKTGVGSIDNNEGVQRFLKLFESDPDDKQIVVTSTLAGLNTWNGLTKRLTSTDDLRFVDKVLLAEPDVELITRTRLETKRDLYLIDHNFKGSYLFPTVFGLEAMAQASLYITGENQPTVIARIENINLPLPIVVDPNDGIEIEIRANVHEKTVEGDRYVHVSIRTEQTGFQQDHFSGRICIKYSQNRN